MKAVLALPLIAGSKTLGGLLVFGAWGFVLGPLLAAVFLSIWAIFAEAYRADLGQSAAEGTAEAAK